MPSIRLAKAVSEWTVLLGGCFLSRCFSQLFCCLVVKCCSMPFYSINLTSDKWTLIYKRVAYLWHHWSHKSLQKACRHRRCINLIIQIHYEEKEVMLFDPKKDKDIKENEANRAKGKAEMSLKMPWVISLKRKKRINKNKDAFLRFCRLRIQSARKARTGVLFDLQVWAFQSFFPPRSKVYRSWRSRRVSWKNPPSLPSCDFLLSIDTSFQFF